MNQSNTIQEHCQYTSYNYVYLDPRKPGQYWYEGLNFSLLYEPFYVGKGCDYRRKYTHLKQFQLRKKSYKTNKIKSIIFSGYDPKLFIIEIYKNISDKTAIENEIHIIKSIGRLDLNTGSLTNLTDGGDGLRNISLERRKFLSDLFKGKTMIQRIGLEKATLMSMRLSISNIGRKHSMSQITNKSNTIKSTKIFVEDKNPKAKDIIVINHNTNEKLYLKGKFAKFCKDNGYTYDFVMKYFNKGIISLELITSEYKSNFTVNSRCMARIKKYIGLEFIVPTLCESSFV